MRILILGAAAGGGFPQWNCACSTCAAFWRGEEGGTARSQSSIAVTADDENWVVFNASPDMREQIIARPQMHPRPERGLRDSPIASVVLTNGDLDHVAGLLSLREKHPLGLHMTGEIANVIDANPVFAALDPAFVTRNRIALDAPFEPVPGVTVKLFAVPGKVPLYMEGENPEGMIDTQMVGEQTVGAEITGGGKRAMYIPGCAAVPNDLKARIEGADLLMFDGTLWTDDEMQREGVGQKTGARMGHMSVSGADGTMATFAGSTIARRVLVHLNNTNPLLLPKSEQRAEAEARGWEVSFDGMELSL